MGRLIDNHLDRNKQNREIERQKGLNRRTIISASLITDILAVTAFRVAMAALSHTSWTGREMPKHTEENPFFLCTLHSKGLFYLIT